MKKLIVAEKPSVAKDIARVLGAKSRGDGYLYGEDDQQPTLFVADKALCDKAKAADALKVNLSTLYCTRHSTESVARQNLYRRTLVLLCRYMVKRACVALYCNLFHTIQIEEPPQTGTALYILYYAHGLPLLSPCW